MFDKYLKNIDDYLIKFGEFKPTPNINDRDWWDNKLPKSSRIDLANNAKFAELIPWPNLTASLYFENHVTGNRENYGEKFFIKRSLLWHLCIGECINNNGKYMCKIMDAIWNICEESSWCLPEHNRYYTNKTGLPEIYIPVIDLFSADTSALLSFVYYILYEKLNALSSTISKRIEYEIMKRIINPFISQNNFWWMGLEECKVDGDEWMKSDKKVNNWNPWIISNIIPSALFTVSCQDMRKKVIKKSIACLERYIDSMPDDGGCDEGPTYWGVGGGKLFEAIEQIRLAIKADTDIYSDDKICNIFEFVYKIYIGNRYYVNFADGAAIPNLSGEMIYEIGNVINNDIMINHGKFIVSDQIKYEVDTPIIRNYSPLSWFRKYNYLIDNIESNGNPCLKKICFLPQTEILSIRQYEGETDGFYFSCKGGNNCESHNHNDIANFIIFYDGKPVIIDAGVGIYTEDTFNKNRYTIWTMRSKYHNIPVINGYEQCAGAEYKASLFSFKNGNECTIEFGNAYPKDANIKSLVREISIIDNDKYIINISDKWKLNKYLNDNIWNFLLYNKPMYLNSQNFSISDDIILSHNIDNIEFHIEEIIVDDKKLLLSWDKPIYRLSIIDKTMKLNGESIFKIKKM